jgi:hypothetical protein
MIGPIFLIIFGGLFVGYTWLAYHGVRAIYRKTNSWILAGLGVLVFLLIPSGDTIFNRWYHTNVLCKQEDVGLKMFQKVQLPPRYYDENGRFKAPEKWGLNGTVLEGRFQYRAGSEHKGQFPFTGYEKRYSGVFDLQQGKYLSYEAEFWNAGSGWWLVPFERIFKQLTYNGAPVYIGRGKHCLELSVTTNFSIAAERTVFETK